MKYVESFKKLGYDLKAPRQDWSAENETGVCITIWQDQIEPNSDGLPSFDVWEKHKEWEDTEEAPPFTQQIGHIKRTAHLQNVMDSFDGRVDVIIVEAIKPIPKSGEKGRVCKNAEPWIPEKRKGAFWKITKFCPETGYFRAEVIKL